MYEPLGSRGVRGSHEDAQLTGRDIEHPLSVRSERSQRMYRNDGGQQRLAILQGTQLVAEKRCRDFDEIRAGRWVRGDHPGRVQRAGMRGDDIGAGSVWLDRAAQV